jgi:hypothetical protein
VHRPCFPEDRLASAEAGPATPQGRVWTGLQRLLELRRGTPALGGLRNRVVEVASPQVLAFRREAGGARCVVVASFASRPVTLSPTPLLVALDAIRLVDRLGGSEAVAGGPLVLAPYAFHCFEAAAR